MRTQHAVFVSCAVLGACSGGPGDASAGTDAASPANPTDATTSASDAGSGLPATFFGMSAGPPSAPSEYPSVAVGAVGHPGLLPWPAIQPNDGDPAHAQWAYYDAQVAKAVAHGVPMYISLGWTPRWTLSATEQQAGCKANSNICTLPPDNISDWTAFITLLVTRYAGKVQYYEIWNEANGAGFYTGTQAQLVALAAAAYPIIKSIDPHAVVVAPTTSGFFASATTWLAGYLQLGGAKYADACGAHGYPTYTLTPFPFPEQDNSQTGSILQRLQAFRKTCDENGLANTPLVMSEGSWGPNQYLTDPSEQAAWLARYQILQASAATALDLVGTYWYAWGAGTPADYGSIANPDNSPTPAGTAYGQVDQWLVGAAIAPCVASTDGKTYSCAVTRPADTSYRGLIIWNVTPNATSTVTVDPVYVTARGIDGSKTTLSGSTLSVTMAPVLLEGSTGT